MHVDINKLGNIANRSGHRVLGRRVGQRNRTRTAGKIRDRNRDSHVGSSYMHDTLDDHSRLASSEILPDERKETAVAFSARARNFFAANGITIKRALTDDRQLPQVWLVGTVAGRYRHHTQTDPNLAPPNQQQGRTIQPHPARGMGPCAPYASEAERRAAFTGWLHTYDHHRGHTALDGHPPASRVPNPSDQYTWAARWQAGHVANPADRAADQASAARTLS
ncbi:hypothetical protein [Nocardia tengchongensis]|uniref:hypothetical protein n=1 Tax=Nocardia tengchongensis TaxID=2055889 RepID=UPI00360E681E